MGVKGALEGRKGVRGPLRGTWVKGDPTCLQGRKGVKGYLQRSKGVKGRPAVSQGVIRVFMVIVFVLLSEFG